jgi:hypothetical protein
LTSILRGERRKLRHHRSANGIPSVTESSVALPPHFHGRHLLPDPQTPTLSHRAAARPRCPKCESRMAVQRITAARPGFEHWTLRCVKCGLINEAQVSTDAIKSDAIGWANSDLRAPD